MSVDEWGIVLLIGLVTYTISVSVIKEMLEQGTFKKIQTLLSPAVRQIKISYVIPIIVIFFLITIYALNVGFDPKEPNAAHYGQMGDFFGGILNPFFAMISIVLLLLTYNQTLKNSELEHQRVEREEIRNVINETKKTINTLKSKKSFIISLDNKDEIKSYIYFSVEDCQNNESTNRYAFQKALMFTLASLKHPSNLSKESDELREYLLTHTALGSNFYNLAQIQSLTFRLLDLYIDYLKTQKSKSLHNLMYADFTNFIMESYTQLILTDDQYNEYCEKLIDVTPGVTRHSS